jgi:hypothetical protein
MIHVCGINEIDAGIQASVNHTPRLILICLTSDGHRSEADAGDRQPDRLERYAVHSESSLGVKG